MAEISEIKSTDTVKNSRSVLNTNFSNLNSAKAEKADIQKSTHTYAADTGSANAYEVTLTPAPTAYTTGMKVTFKAANANTGPSTLNVNDLGAKAIKKLVNQDLEGGEIAQNAIVTVVYDGTYFQLETLAHNVVFTTGNQTIGGTKTFSKIIEGSVPKVEAEFTYGETIAVNDAVYLKASDGKVYKTDADYGDERIENFIGFAKEAGNLNDTKKVQIAGKVSGFTGLTTGSIYYLSNTAGAISTTIGTYMKIVGLAVSATELFILSLPIQQNYYRAGDILIQSSDTAKSSTSTTPVKMKEMKLGKGGTLRIYFCLNGAGGAAYKYGQIYRNGVAVGTQRAVLELGSACWTEDISGWKEGDLCQLYCWVQASANSVEVSNFRIYASNVDLAQVTLD